MIDETGNRYFALTVLERAANDKHGKACWKCRCDCGKEVIVVGSNLRRGNTKSCGCGIHNEYQKEHSEIGNVYGKLTVVSFFGRTDYGKLLWNCQCECGNMVIIQTGHLHDGAQISCGKCYKPAANTKDEIGHTYGHLTVLSQAASKNNEAHWNCQCSCGNLCVISGTRLRSGNTTSCGCINSIGEYNIRTILTQANISFIQQYSFADLRLIHPLKFDFAILDADNNLMRLIEFDGPQHKYTEKDKDKLYYDDTLVLRDQMKDNYCRTNHIPLVRLPYKKRDNVTLQDLLGDQFLIEEMRDM